MCSKRHLSAAVWGRARQGPTPIRRGTCAGTLTANGPHVSCRLERGLRPLPGDPRPDFILQRGDLCSFPNLTKGLYFWNSRRLRLFP